MNGEHGEEGCCHSLRVRLVKGQVDLVQVGGHLQVRSGNRKKGTVRERKARQGPSVAKSGSLSEEAISSSFPDCIVSGKLWVQSSHP